jgi:hypothetical protein
VTARLRSPFFHAHCGRAAGRALVQVVWLDRVLREPSIDTSFGNFGVDCAFFKFLRPGLYLFAKVNIVIISINYISAETSILALQFTLAAGSEITLCESWPEHFRRDGYFQAINQIRDKAAEHCVMPTRITPYQASFSSPLPHVQYI